MKVRLCMGSNCVMMGNMQIMTQLEDLKETMGLEDLSIECVKCLGTCKSEGNKVCPVVEVDGEIMKNATSQDVMEKLMKNR